MRNNGIRWILLVSIVPLLMGFCVRPQGIKGQVFLEKDASMPLKGKNKQSGSPYSTMVYVYEAASAQQLIGQQAHWAKGIQAKLIKQVQADKTGHFKLGLRPGKYTLLLGYKDGYYIPFFSGSTGVAFVEVIKHQYQEIDLIASSIF
jgi:hypothetical protein